MDTRIVILAGGKSSRFGSNKARAPWGEKTILENIISTLSVIGVKISISIGNADGYEDINIDKIPDKIPGLGPMGALYSILDTVTEDRVMLIACDMPLVDPFFVKKMIFLPTWAPIVIPLHNRRFEPLHAIYHRSLQPLVAHLIKRKRLKMGFLLDMVPFRSIFPEEGLELAFSNVNTKDEYEKLLKFRCNGIRAFR